RDLTGLVETVSRYEPVVLNVRDAEVEADARARLRAAGADLARVEFHRVPLNDAWFRDNGPLFVREADGRVAMTDWRSNAWEARTPPGTRTTGRRWRWPAGSACAATPSTPSWRAARSS